MRIVLNLLPAMIAALSMLPASCTAQDAAIPKVDLKQYKPTDRPFLYGCGVFWGKWYGLDGEKRDKWDALSMDYIVRMGGTTVGAGPAWPDVERVRGVYDWTESDRTVKLANDRGLTIFAYNGSTPMWALPANAPRDASGNFLEGFNHRFPCAEEFTEDFDRYYEAAARRYRGKIKYYSFWNEPNGCSWMKDGCGNMDMAHTYTPWLIRWYKAMKKGDPDCVLSVGGIDYHSGVRDGWRYFEDIYSNGGGDSFDAVTIHPYGEPLHWQAIHDTYACLVRHGDGHKKIWIGEYGWNTGDEQRKSENLVAVLNELKKPEYHMIFRANFLVLTNLNKDGHDYGLCGQDPENGIISPYASYETFKNYDKSFGPDSNKPPRARTPTPLPAPVRIADGTNLLKNPNFEEDFETIGDASAAPKHEKAKNWEVWGGNWWTRSGGDGHLNHSPFGAQSAGTDWGVLKNAVYQTVPTIKGRKYQFAAWTRVDSPQTGEFLRRRVGIDSTGGTDPLSPTVKWSPWSMNQQTWEQQAVNAKAKGSTITVFAYGETIQSNGFQWFHVDTAQLVDVTK